MCRWGALEVGESLVETRAGNVRGEGVAEAGAEVTFGAVKGSP
jgi:hypothetical protein